MLEKVIAVIADQLNIEAEKITADSNLVEDLKADSLDVAALMLELEEQYNVEILEEDLASLHTVRDITDYIAKKAG